MNEKLKAWEGRMSDKMPGRGSGRGGVRSDALVALRKNSEPNRNGHNNGRDVLRVTFHPRLDALTGWKKGDVLDMDISGNIATVFRHTKGARLCDSGTATARKYVRYSFPNGSLLGLTVGDCSEVEAKPGSVAFVLPK